MKKLLGYSLILLLFALFVWRQWPSADRSVQFAHAQDLDQHLSLVFEGRAKVDQLVRDDRQSTALTHNRRQLFLLAQVLVLPELADPEANEQQLWREMAKIIAEDEQAWQQSARFVAAPSISQAVAYELHQPAVNPGERERWMRVWLWPYSNRIYKVSSVHDGSQQAIGRQSEFENLLRWQAKAVQN